MGAPKLTPWFEPGTDPEHAGVYEVELENGARRWACWHGMYWAWPHPNRGRAAKAKNLFSSATRFRWRGHACPSKEFLRLNGG